MVDRIERMRKASFTLSHLGEFEAIGQSTKRVKQQTSFDFKQKLKRQQKKSTLIGNDLTSRVWLSLMQVRSSILDAFRLALVQKLDAQKILAKVRDAFPKTQVYKKPPRALRPIKESHYLKECRFEVSPDFVDEDDWKLAVDAYKDSELPASRFDQGAEYDPETSTMTYNWELEQDLTDDFVQQVRDGQVDAANELGIQEFVWIAIIDNKTCDDCCIPRNGMTTSEIEDALDSGKLDDDCDATSPPAHPNCRCQLAPVASTDDVEGPDWKSVGEWLNS